MSNKNFEFRRGQSAVANTRTITATATARTGRVADNFVFDNPIIVDDPAADVTLTIPDGSYVGQLLLVNLTGNASSKTLTVTCTTGTDYSTSTDGQYTLMIWSGATAGWAKVSGNMT